MDYLQYEKDGYTDVKLTVGFKPCYKWITFNTKYRTQE